MFSKNIFTIIVNGLFCLNIAIPVLAQKQTSNSSASKKEALFGRRRFSRILSKSKKQNTYKQQSDPIISDYITPVHSSSKKKIVQLVLEERICRNLPSGQTFRKN